MTVRVSGLTYRYPGAESAALRGVEATFEPGSLTLLCGPSAGGKSTLLRSINGLVPQFYGGTYTGSVTVGGFDAATTPARRMATVAGMVFQEPEAQAIAEHVEDEIAFGMEQQGLPASEMLRRCTRVLEQLGIGHLRHRRIGTLSGGERQRVAIASVLALEPAVLLLDEPTSQLDPDGAESVLAAVEALAGRGLTVLVAEHRLERLLPLATKVAAVQRGELQLADRAQALQLLPSPPPLVRLAGRLGLDHIPASIREWRAAVREMEFAIEACKRTAAPGDVVLSTDGLTVRFGEVTALDGVSIRLREGEVVAVVGPNGSGKTTLFRALSGAQQSEQGTVSFREKAAPPKVADRTAFAGLVPQDPALALYRDTVRDELAETLTLRGDRGRNVDEALDRWALKPLATQNPRDLSVGQQQRVAIAAMLAHEPPIWLLDEPTRGADTEAKRWLARALREHAAAGGAAVVSTHDIETAATFATRVIGLERGKVAFDLPVRQALGQEGPLPTQVAQVVPGALLAEQVSRR